MRVRLRAWAALALAGALAQAQERPSPVFPSAVELVTVDVVVLGKDGRPVRGLSREDFRLIEDGKPQRLASFEAFDLGSAEAPPTAGPSAGPGPKAAPSRGAAGRAFVLLVDDLGLTPTTVEYVRQALPRFLEDSFDPGDEVTLATTSGAIWWSVRLPEGRDDLLALVGRLQGHRLAENSSEWMSEWEAYRIDSFEGPRGQTAGTTPPDQAPSLSRIPGSLEDMVAGGQPPPGTNMVGRVVSRWIGTGVCSEWNASMCAHMVRMRASELDSLRRDRTRSVLAGVERAVFSLTGVPGRKELLFFSDGFLHDQSSPEVRAVAGRCREANVVVNFIGARGLVASIEEQTAAFPGPAPDSSELGLIQMERTVFEIEGSAGLAEDTGGLALTTTNDLGAAARRVVDESSSYYLLGFHPPDGKGPRDWRRVQVEVNRPGLRVRARKGYTLRPAHEVARSVLEGAQGKKQDSKTASDGDGAANVSIARALLNAREERGLGVSALPYVSDEVEAGRSRVLVAVEVDPRSIDLQRGSGRLSGSLFLSMVAVNRDSGKSARLDRRIDLSYAGTTPPARTILQGEFDLPPGAALTRVVVRDERSGRLGATTARFEVPAAEGLRFATVLLTDEVRPPDRDGERPQPVLRARRVFEPGGRLYCQLRVLGAAAGASGGAPRVEASYVLRQSTGPVVRRGEPTLIAAEPGAPVIRLWGLPLDELSAGDYELVLRAVDQTTGEVIERAEPFRLSAAPAS